MWAEGDDALEGVNGDKAAVVSELVSRCLQGIVDILNLINGIGCRGYDFTKQGNNFLLGLLDAVLELQPGFAALTIFIV